MKKSMKMRKQSGRGKYEWKTTPITDAVELRRLAEADRIEEERERINAEVKRVNADLEKKTK
jgi:hypothetical protein